MMTGYKKILFVPFLTLILILVHQTASAQTESCVAGKCHSNMGKEKTVHNPVKEGMCSICHQAVQEQGTKTKHPGNLTISLVMQGANLCYMCHEQKNTKKTVHAPIAGGDCTSCHNPHQSPNKAMLKDAVPKLCFQCHPDDMIKHKVMHPPVAAGDCSNCHDNHQSDFPHRLVQEGNSLCFMCHPEKEDGLRTKKAVHPPVSQSCTLCHNPHGSSTKALLISAVPALCSNCHPNESLLTERALVNHGPMNDRKSCMNCHDPHFAEFRKLLPTAQYDLCLSCHNKEITAEDGPIADMKTFFDANRNGHGPVKKGICTDCHNPHGSDYWRILSRYYPSDFYTSYSDGKYAICFSCHSKAAFADLRTNDATGFRDGKKNLHFIHVNKAAKGRTCRACHEVHADSDRPSHVKDFVGFSNWSMPMNYIPAKDGGTCAPGCHGEKTYSR